MSEQEHAVTTPANYRKRPVVVEAIQWTGDNVNDIRAFAGPKFDTVDIEDRGDDPDVTGQILDDLHSTWLGVKDGQWILRGAKGEFYPCEPEVFAEVYEPADAPAAADDHGHPGGYLSTACLHGLCEPECGAAQRARGYVGHPTCKYCSAKCAHSCHTGGQVDRAERIHAPGCTLAADDPHHTGWCLLAADVPASDEGSE